MIDETAHREIANLTVRIERLEISRQEAAGQNEEIEGLSDALEKAQFVADSANVALGKLAEVGTAMVNLGRELAESRRRVQELEAQLGGTRPRPWWRFG